MNGPDPDGAAPAEPRYLSTAQVADALGVSVTTVKRWVDDDVLPAHRTAGGHRKLLLADVLRLAREGNLPRADLARLVTRPRAATADPDHLAGRLVDAIRAADHDLIRSVIHGGYRSGLAIDVLADRVVARAMAQVGEDCATGRLDIMREHRGTQGCVAALYELRGVVRTDTGKDRPLALGGAPEHDHTIMPTLLAKLTLLDAGWAAVNLGPHTPVAAFRAGIEGLSPRLVWLSASHLADPERFLAEYADLFRYAEDRGVPVAVGGRALTDAVRVRMTYTTYGDGMAQLAAFARSIYRSPQRPKRGRPPGPGRKARAEAVDRTPDG